MANGPDRLNYGYREALEAKAAEVAKHYPVLYWPDGRRFTTEDAVNVAMGVKGAVNRSELNPEDLLIARNYVIQSD